MLQAKSESYVADPLTVIPRILTKLHSLWVIATYPFAESGPRVSIHYSAELHRPAAHRIKLGRDVCIGKDVWLNVARSRDSQNDPAIVIDDNCTIARGSMISAKNSIHFERDVLFGPSALIMDHSHAYEDVTQPIRDQGITEGGRIRIGQGCWIGHGAVIVCVQGELTLGRNCVVGANSLVTRSSPPYSIISGNPARVVKQFDPIKKVWVLGSARTAEVAAVRQPEDAAAVSQLV